jgi:multiple sugar transport system permease protein
MQETKQLTATRNPVKDLFAAKPLARIRRSKSAQERRFFWIGLAFAMPWIIGFLLFKIYPICSAIYYSFTDYNMFRDPTWVGLKNYTDLFADKYVQKSFSNTAYMVIIGLPVTLAFSLLIAMIMNIRAKGMPLFRTILYLPSVVPSMASALLFLWVMNSRYGIVNNALSAIGLKGPSWLNDPSWTKVTLIIMGCWGCGGTAVIFLAALKSVPHELYEAAKIDGASRWNQFWRITIPMISPTIQFQFIMGIIGMFQYFSQAFVFNMFTGSAGQVTGGGPSNSMLFYSINLYREAFDYLHMGYASALAMVLFIIILVVTWISMRVSDKMVTYSAE